MLGLILLLPYDKIAGGERRAGERRAKVPVPVRNWRKMSETTVRPIHSSEVKKMKANNSPGFTECGNKFICRLGKTFVYPF